MKVKFLNMCSRKDNGTLFFAILPMEGVLLAPLWAGLYSGYIFLMVKRYIGL